MLVLLGFFSLIEEEIWRESKKETQFKQIKTKTDQKKIKNNEKNKMKKMKNKMKI